MDRRHESLEGLGDEIEAYCASLMEVAAGIRLPAIFAGQRPGTIYRVERHGVVTVGIRRSSISDAELVQLLRYRLGQYVHPSTSIIDPRLVYASRLEHEPLENESNGDIHFISGDAETGAVLCYAVLRSLPNPPEGKTLKDRDRPFLPVEKVNGWGVFNRLQILPDLPVSQIFELGRYVKNLCLKTSVELSTRAPLETALAVFLSIIGPLKGEVSGFVGDLEERIAKRTLDFFHIPLVLIRGVVPYSPEASYFFPRNQYATVYPFAALAADVEKSICRFREIDEALQLPGRDFLRATFALKDTSAAPHSSLEPPEGLAPLATVELPDQGGDNRLRRKILDIAEQLRLVDPFCNLSDAEMRLLSGFMERRAVPRGETIVRQGEVSDDLYLIEEGEAEIRKRIGDGPAEPVALLGPRSYFGEIALLRGGERTADVVAHSPMVVLRLNKESYNRFLGRLEVIQQRIDRMASERVNSREAVF